MADIAKMRNVLDHIERFPENHDQDSWSSTDLARLAADNGDHPECGTTMCMAGWTAFLYAPKGTRMVSGGWLSRNGKEEYQHCADFAREELGLEHGQSDALFLDADDLDDLKAMTAALEANPEIDMDGLVGAMWADQGAKPVTT